MRSRNKLMIVAVPRSRGREVSPSYPATPRRRDLLIASPALLLLPRALWKPCAGTKKEGGIHVKRSVLIVLVLMFALVALPSFAGPVPSKTAANQSLDARWADLALVRDVAANDQVARVLASHGFTQEQVNQRLAQLSPQDLHQLAQNLNQLQAAGITRQEWYWIAIGAGAVLLIILLTR